MTSLRLLELGVVLLGLATLARVAARFGFSAIPLYLAAGLAFGDGGLLPLVVAEEFIEAGADIGLVLLLLMLGLEYSADELGATLRQSTRTAAVNAALNFIPGMATGFLLGWDPLPAAFLGGVTYVTSSGIASKLLEELGWIGNRETPIVLSVLVLEDLTMALYLPIVSALAFGDGPISTTVALGVAVATVFVVMVVALRHGGIVSRLLFSHSDESLLLGILGVAVFVAGVLETARGSAAVGAFLVGIALSGPAADRARPLLRPLRDLFAAVFFVFFGLRVVPASILPVLSVAVALAVVTAGTKVVTGWAMAARAGIGRRGRWRAGAMLVARGEFSIAIAALGVAAGLEPQLEPLSAAYVLILAIVGPIVVRVVGSLLPPRTPPVM